MSKNRRNQGRKLTQLPDSHILLFTAVVGARLQPGRDFPAGMYFERGKSRWFDGTTFHQVGVFIDHDPHAIIHRGRAPIGVFNIRKLEQLQKLLDRALAEGEQLGGKLERMSGTLRRASSG